MFSLFFWCTYDDVALRSEPKKWKIRKKKFQKSSRHFFIRAVQFNTTQVSPQNIVIIEKICWDWCRCWELIVTKTISASEFITSASPYIHVKAYDVKPFIEYWLCMFFSQSIVKQRVYVYIFPACLWIECHIMNR